MIWTLLVSDKTLTSLTAETIVATGLTSGSKLLVFYVTSFKSLATNLDNDKASFVTPLTPKNYSQM